MTRAVLAVLLIASPLEASDAAPAASPLIFESEERVIEVGFLPRQFWVDFVFRVEGQGSVTIRSHTSSCPCTTVAMERTTYYPGQKGLIGAIYDYRGQAEPAEEVIDVVTDRSARPHRLRVVPRRTATALWAERRELQWFGAPARRSQSIEVEVAPGFRARPPAVASCPPGWRARVEAGAQEGAWRLTVEPETESPARGILVLRVEADASTATAGAGRDLEIELRPAGEGASG